MLMRSTDPFRDFDRLAQQLLGAGTTSRPAVMPMDAWRQGDTFVVEFDLPGVRPETLDIDVERNVLTVKAERTRPNGDWEMLASERPTGPVQPAAGARRQRRSRTGAGGLRRRGVAPDDPRRGEGQAPQDRGHPGQQHRTGCHHVLTRHASTHDADSLVLPHPTLHPLHRTSCSYARHADGGGVGRPPRRRRRLGPTRVRGDRGGRLGWAGPATPGAPSGRPAAAPARVRRATGARARADRLPRGRRGRRTSARSALTPHIGRPRPDGTAHPTYAARVGGVRSPRSRPRRRISRRYRGPGRGVPRSWRQQEGSRCGHDGATDPARSRWSAMQSQWATWRTAGRERPRPTTSTWTIATRM